MTCPVGQANSITEMHAPPKAHQANPPTAPSRDCLTERDPAPSIKLDKRSYPSQHRPNRTHTTHYRFSPVGQANSITEKHAPSKAHQANSPAAPSRDCLTERDPAPSIKLD